MPSNTGKNARSPALTKTTKRYATQERVLPVRVVNGIKKKTIIGLM